MHSLIACECLSSPCSLKAPPFQQDDCTSINTNMSVLVRSVTSAATTKAAPVLFDQLDKALKGDEGKDLIAKTRVRQACWFVLLLDSPNMHIFLLGSETRSWCIFGKLP